MSCKYGHKHEPLHDCLSVAVVIRCLSLMKSHTYSWIETSVSLQHACMMETQNESMCDSSTHTCSHSEIHTHTHTQNHMYLHVNVPLSSSGRTSELRVTVPLTLTSRPGACKSSSSSIQSAQHSCEETYKQLIQRHTYIPVQKTRSGLSGQTICLISVLFLLAKIQTLCVIRPSRSKKALRCTQHKPILSVLRSLTCMI